jgi:hypothetical protein
LVVLKQIDIQIDVILFGREEDLISCSMVTIVNVLIEKSENVRSYFAVEKLLNLFA